MSIGEIVACAASALGRGVSLGWGESEAEPIEMLKRRHAYFPEEFLWHGHRYRVFGVDRCWTVSRRNGRVRTERLCFRVCCREGRFDLYQDVRFNTWHVQMQVL